MKRVKQLLCILPILFFCIGCHDEEKVSSCLPTKEEYEFNEINPDYVPIDWETTQLLECNPDKGVYSFKSSATTSNLRAGSVLTIDADTANYIVVVKQIAYNNDIITIETLSGSLCDIFANTEFTLATSELAATRSSGKVYYPESITYSDSTGILKTLNIANTRSDVSLTDNLWDWGEDFNGEELFSNDKCKLYLEKALFNVSIDLKLTLSFGERTPLASQAEAFIQYQSKALKVDASIIGNASTEQTLRFDVWGEYRNKDQENGEDKLWKQNIFKPVDITFTVGSVPIKIKLNADLYRGASLDTKGKISAYMGFSDTATGELGFSYRQEAGVKPISKFENEFNLIYPTLEGHGKIAAKAWLYPRIQVWVYGIVGPSFDIKPYIGTHVEGGFREELLGSSNDFCAWSLRNYAGLDVTTGLSLAFLNHELKNYATPTINIIDKTLYRSPDSITFISSTSPKVESGITNTVTFGVYDIDSIFDKKLVTPLPQIVKFEGNGTLSSKYGIASQGKVSVEWMPQSASDTLYAILYNSNGDKIKQARFFGDTPKAITGEYSEVTYNSAKAMCAYENIPNGAECGIIISSSNASDTIPANIIGSSGEFIFGLTGLLPETEYSYNAYILFQNTYYKGDPRSFITNKEKDSDITSGEIIDLGLSVKWASHNVGTTFPYESGGLYGWGDPTGLHKEQDSDKKYGHYVEDCSDIYPDSEKAPTNISGTSYDLARAKWGGSWRIPTLSNFQELKLKCIWKFITYNGCKGYKIIGPNGNSIFLPCTSQRLGDTIKENGVAYVCGHQIALNYWTATRPKGSSLARYVWACTNNDIALGYACNPCYGMAIRPVTD